MKLIPGNYLHSNMLSSDLQIVERNTDPGKNFNRLTFKTENSSPIAFEFSCPEKTSCRQLTLTFCSHLVSSFCCEKQMQVVGCSPIVTEFSCPDGTHSRQLPLQQFGVKIVLRKKIQVIIPFDCCWRPQTVVRYLQISHVQIKLFSRN